VLHGNVRLCGLTSRRIARLNGVRQHLGEFLVTLLKQSRRRAFGETGGGGILPLERRGTKE